MSYYIEVLKKYAVFTGRAGRMEYWMFALFNILISVVLTVVDYAAGTGFLGTVYSLAVLLPGLAVTARRLHDTNRSGWWMLIALVPVVGAIVLLVFMAIDGHPGDNQYGPDPKALGGGGSDAGGGEPVAPAPTQDVPTEG